ncbi:MAG: diacylglycerol kinase family protein [Bacteroidia bacterium]|nr:diacylglycerol kinase family protein [Bacteroidia bacterium]MCF8425879.1 diacylglycerol kinase family protein [Bacteroidia bacterium]MCF8445658.1 diacylglycerol kinase family protein [Bacteroidia bacterium]
MKKESFSIQKRLKSFVFAGKGIITLVKEEHNAQIHLVISLLVLAAGFYLGLSNSEWMLIVFLIGFVFALEAINSSIENLADFVSPNQHPLIGKVKDLAAGAVLIGAICAAIIGLLIFIPKLLLLV